MTISLPSDADATGRDLGDAELALLAEAIRSGCLTSTKGKMVPRLEKEFAKRYGVSRAIACASGSAAVHAAVAAIDPSPGDEIVTTPITDMGAISAILYQGAIPVFADVDPHSLEVTAETIAPRLTKHTKAIIVTHLFGLPCRMQPILELARSRGIPVIEDVAQAFLAEEDGKLCGTFGRISCFSFQQGKHMTAGEGGMVVTDDPALARRVTVFVNKAWPYGEANPDHEFLAPNYRMTELQGAVLVAQLAKLDGCVDRRIKAAERFRELLPKLPGIEHPPLRANAKHVYWKYALRISDPDRLTKIATGLKARGIASVPRYIQKPAFECKVIRERVTFGSSHWPWEGAHMQGRAPVVYDGATFPGTRAGLASVLVLPWNEAYREEHLQHLASSLVEVAK